MPDQAMPAVLLCAMPMFVAAPAVARGGMVPGTLKIPIRAELATIQPACLQATTTL